jgi:hypothetical protein
MDRSSLRRGAPAALAVVATLLASCDDGARPVPPEVAEPQLELTLTQRFGQQMGAVDIVAEGTNRADRNILATFGCRGPIEFRLFDSRDVELYWYDPRVQPGCMDVRSALEPGQRVFQSDVIAGTLYAPDGTRSAMARGDYRVRAWMLWWVPGDRRARVVETDAALTWSGP